MDTNKELFSLLNENLRKLMTSYMECQLECERYAAKMTEYQLQISELDKKIGEVSKLIESAGDKHEI